MHLSAQFFSHDRLAEASDGGLDICLHKSRGLERCEPQSQVWSAEKGRSGGVENRQALIGAGIFVLYEDLCVAFRLPTHSDKKAEGMIKVDDTDRCFLFRTSKSHERNKV